MPQMCDQHVPHPRHSRAHFLVPEQADREAYDEYVKDHEYLKEHGFKWLGDRGESSRQHGDCVFHHPAGFSLKSRQCTW